MSDEGAESKPRPLLTDMLSDGDRLALRGVIEDELIKSPVYKLGKWVLTSIAVIVAGIWLGGTIYLGFKIPSVMEQIAGVETQLRDTRNKIEDMLTKNKEQMSKHVEELRTQVKEKTKEVSGFVGEQKEEIKKAVKSIEDQRTDVETKKRAAVAAIESEKEEAKKVLNVENLRELREVQQRIDALKQATTKLDLRSLAAIVGPPVWALLGATILAAAAALLALYRTGIIRGGGKKGD